MALIRSLGRTCRPLIRNPGFSLVVAATAALGIGTATAVFSLVYGILLRPYPYREPDRLVRVQSRYVEQGGHLRGLSLLDIEDYRRRAVTIEDIGAYTAFETQIVGDGPGHVVTIAQANPAALIMLGVEPALGRLLQPEEDRPGGDVHKALISYGLWQTHFGRDPDILGKIVRTDRRGYTIVGVMPQGFAFPTKSSIWTPMESFYASLADDRAIKRRDSRWYSTVARLKPGVSAEQGEAELNRVAEALEREYPVENRGIRVKLTPLRESETGELRPYLLLLMSGVSVVVLICCANVAALLLVRAAGRRRDLTIRATLGAGRGRIVRALLLESLLLALAGGLVGIGLAYAGVNALVALIPVTLPFWMTIEVDRAVLGFSLLLTVLTGVLFGLAPALQASRLDVSLALKEGARGSIARGRFRAVLVVSEVALSLVLLVCAALLMQTLIRLQAVGTGFMSEGLLTVRIIKYQAGTRRESAALLSTAHARVLEGLRRIPGVSSASVTNSLPFTGTQTERSRADIAIRGRAKEDTKILAPLAGADVSADYFRTMHIPLVRGRLFDDSDTNSSPFVVVINERGAKLLWPDRDPIGEELLWGQLTPSNPYCRIVGIVGDVRHQAAEGDNGIELYYPITQWPVANSYYVVRTAANPDALAIAVRSAIESADPAAAVAEIKTMQRKMGESLWEERLWGTMFGVFSGLALLLAAVGLYGVMSHSVAQRTREIGIRMALGARPGAVARMVVGEALLLVSTGGLLGFAMSAGVGRTIRSFLHGVAPYDPGLYLTVAAVLSAVALLAVWLPAYRASRIDPIVALRSE
jgi:putative ABC transport system permease protein